MADTGRTNLTGHPEGHMDPHRPDTRPHFLYRHHLHRPKASATMPGISRSIMAKATMAQEEALPVRKAVITPWPGLTSSQRSLTASMITSKRRPTYRLPCSGATALSQERGVMRTPTMMTTRCASRTTTRSGNDVPKLMPLIGKQGSFMSFVQSSEADEL